MIKQKVTIINKLGLHARAASKFVGIASAYTSYITVSFEDKIIDGKSIMAVMMLAAGKGSTLELTIEGEDEVEALNAVSELIKARFGEAE